MLFVKYAREAKARGKKVGAKACWERCRWDSHLEVQGALAYDYNNNFVSRYARLAMMQEPDLAGFFDTRALKRKEIPPGPYTKDPDEGRRTHFNDHSGVEDYPANEGG